MPGLASVLCRPVRTASTVSPGGLALCGLATIVTNPCTDTAPSPCIQSCRGIHRIKAVALPSAPSFISGGVLTPYFNCRPLSSFPPEESAPPNFRMRLASHVMRVRPATRSGAGIPRHRRTVSRIYRDRMVRHFMTDSLLRLARCMKASEWSSDLAALLACHVRRSDALQHA